jgi:hypothetical protein
MWDVATKDYYIFKLDTGTQTWVKTGVRLDTRYNSRADTLWDGTHLYVASHVYSNHPAPGYPSRLYRFSYDSTSKTYTLDPGFPVQINNLKTETLVIARDSAGKLWATWVYANKVYVNRTEGGDSEWGTPFALGAAGADNVSLDDISSVITFGNNIGIMWSNQVDDAFYFAIHHTGNARTSWGSSTTVLQGPKVGNDHINLKADGAGDVFAVIKTEATASSAPYVVALKRSAATGGWAQSVVGRVTDSHTRPILLLDEEHDRIYVFDSAPCCSGGTIYVKSSSATSMSFPAGRGTPFIHDAASPKLNDVTSTKQNVNAITGMLVLASNDVTDTYWHGFNSLVTPSATITGGPAGWVNQPDATFTFTSDSPSATFTCSLDGAAFTPCTSPHTYTSLAENGHVFGVSADGGPEATVNWLVDTFPPGALSIATRGGINGFQRSRTVRVKWSASDSGSGVSGFDIHYKKTRWNGGSGSFVNWKLGTTRKSATFSAKPGYTYCFSVKAHDQAGNTSSSSSDACTTIPLDDRGLSAKGSWVRGSARGDYMSTYSRSFSRSSSLLKTAVRAKRLALLVTRCPGCGSVKVLWNGHVLERVSLAASRIRRKQVIPLITFNALSTGSLRIVVMSRDKKVEIDGLEVSAT